MGLKDLVRSRKDEIRPGAYTPTPNKLFGPRGLPVEDSEELQRILALPRRPPVDLDSDKARAIVLRETAKYRRDRDAEGLGPCRCREIDPSSKCITQLLPVQAVTLREISMAQGLWGSILTGGGKSILDLLAILALDNCKMGLLLVPANLMKQICGQYQMLSQHFRVPNIIVHRSDGDWQDCRWPDEPVLHVMSHNGISSPRQSDYIENIAPDVIIIDEQDHVADLASARTIRLARFMAEHPTTKYCGWTGSPSDQRLSEVAHLMFYALKDKSPLPISTMEVERWGTAVDAVDVPAPAGALAALIGAEDEGENETAMLRSAIRRRLEDTQGIVMTSSADVEVEDGEGLVAVEVLEKDAPELPEIIQRALEMVRAGERPDTLAGNEHNDTFDDPMKQVRCAREVACGMFYRWKFPRGERADVIDAWFEARREWSGEVRSRIMKGERYLDSPNLCEVAARRHYGELPVDHSRPTWASKSWPRWRDVRDTVQPEQDIVRLHDYLVRDAAEWALSNHGIVWYSVVEIAQWMAEISGLPVYGGGPDAEERIERLIKSPRDVGSVIASINSHGRGRDGLQRRYDQQLIVNMPSSGRRCQQLLARLHRRGQRSEVVRSWIYVHTDELRSGYLQALRRADYAEALLGQKQKLRMGVGDVQLA